MKIFPRHELFAKVCYVCYRVLNKPKKDCQRVSNSGEIWPNLVTLFHIERSESLKPGPTTIVLQILLELKHESHILYLELLLP